VHSLHPGPENKKQTNFNFACAHCFCILLLGHDMQLNKIIEVNKPKLTKTVFLIVVVDTGFITLQRIIDAQRQTQSYNNAEV
jgi:hypothetical protein